MDFLLVNVEGWGNLDLWEEKNNLMNINYLFINHISITLDNKYMYSVIF
jgi:hypothetical protein